MSLGGNVFLPVNSRWYLSRFAAASYLLVLSPVGNKEHQCQWVGMYIISAFVSLFLPLFQSSSLNQSSISLPNAYKLFLFDDIKLMVFMAEPFLPLFLCTSDSLLQLTAEKTHFLPISCSLCFSIPWPLFHVNSVGYLNISLEKAVGWGGKL